jgi:predicted ATPase
VWLPLYLASLARAYADLGKFDDAWRSIREAISAIETTMERWWEAEVHRTAGEIALRVPEPDTLKAQAYFERSLAVARAAGKARSDEHGRLWTNQGKRDEAPDLLAPIYGWFTEGFGTLDVKEAKTLLDDLRA